MLNAKKLTALLLSLAMLLALAACGSGKAAETAAPEPTAAPAETTPSAAAEPSPAAEIGIGILYEADKDMQNNYSLLAVNPEAPFADADGKAVEGVKINQAGAAALINWILSSEGSQLIAEYGQKEYGESLFTLKEDAPVSTASIPKATEETKTIRMSTTTSVNDSGLLDYLLPVFEDTYGYTVEVFSAGTGKAIANAQYGNADLIFVHSKAQEEKFVADGFSYILDGQTSERLTFMYNYFVLLGPKDDPALVAKCASVKDAFAAIANGQYPFVSRGDGSGTHTKEVSLWPEELGITTESKSVENYTSWYTFSNAGMGVCLKMANETGAYILSDKATFLAFRANGGVIE